MRTATVVTMMKLIVMIRVMVRVMMRVMMKVMINISERDWNAVAEALICVRRTWPKLTPDQTMIKMMAMIAMMVMVMINMIMMINVLVLLRHQCRPLNHKKANLNFFNISLSSATGTVDARAVTLEGCRTSEVSQSSLRPCVDLVIPPIWSPQALFQLWRRERDYPWSCMWK